MKSEATTPAPISQSSRNALDASLVSGVAWTGASKWLTQIVAWASTLIVARILTPNDYGVVTMGTVYLGLITLMSQFGVDAAVVTMRELSEYELAELNGLSVLLGLVGFAISFLVAAPLGRLFGSAQLPAVLIVMSLGFVISSLQTVPASLLQRQMNFKFLSIVDGVRALALALATVAMAWAGFGYWSLVYGVILSAAVSTGLTLAGKRAGFAWPRFHSSHAVRFSWHVLVSRVSWYGYSNADFVVSGRVLGQAALGSYSLAWNLANVPIEKVTSLISGVTPSFFSATQNDLASMRRYLLRLTEVLAFVTFPLTVGLAFTARNFVLIVLGAKWAGAITALELLALYASVRSITPLLGQILLATRDSRFMMWNNVAAAFAFPIAFYAGARFGIAGIAAAWMVVYPLVTVPLYWRVFRKIELKVGEYLRALAPALTATLAMAAGLIIFEFAFPRRVSVASLLQQIIVGALIYGSVALVFHRQRLRAYQQALGLLRIQAPISASAKDASLTLGT